MKKISTLFLIILCLCLALALASCGEHTHNFSADEGTVIIEPTCMYEGKLVRTCECGKTKVETLDKFPHSYSESISYDNAYHYYACTSEKCTSVKELTPHEWVIDASKTVAATCNALGSETYNCACGAKKTVNIPQIREHVWDNGVDSAATCIATGVRTFTCTICAETRTEELPLVPHVFDTVYTVTETHHYLACKTSGCEEIKEESYGEHTWDNGTVTLEPTCMELGEMTYACTVCETTKTEEIAELPHAFSKDYQSDATYHYHYCTNPGCTAIDDNAHTWGDAVISPDGDVQISTCTECGKTKEDAVEFHSYSTWFYDETKHYKKCTVKGHTDISEEGAHVWDNGTVTVNPTPSALGEIVYSCECGCKETRPLLYSENASSNTVVSSTWDNAFKEGTFGNFAVQGSFINSDNVSFEAGVMLEGEKSWEIVVGENGLVNTYYSVEDGVNYVYTYDSETEKWSKAESDFAYSESYFVNLFDASEKFFSFEYVIADGCYAAENVSIGATEYTYISFTFENGVLTELSATLKNEMNFFGNTVKAFDLEFMLYGDALVELPSVE